MTGYPNYVGRHCSMKLSMHCGTNLPEHLTVVSGGLLIVIQLTLPPPASTTPVGNLATGF